MIRAGGNLGQGVPVVGSAMKVGTDMTADLTSKLMRENIVEPGRVNFPAVVRHNYNHLFQSIRVVDADSPSPLDPAKIEHPAPAPATPAPAPAAPAAPGAPAQPAQAGQQAAPAAAKLDVKGAPGTDTKELKK